MKTWLVKRQHDNVIVTIMKNKSDETYSFINLTKEHICSCKFNSINDALKDMNRLKDCGKIINYFELK
jgi:hypothetical protein|nr:MAG TPA: hypothetical protein [Caudoviricetes sp.]